MRRVLNILLTARRFLSLYGSDRREIVKMNPNPSKIVIGKKIKELTRGLIVNHQLTNQIKKRG